MSLSRVPEELSALGAIAKDCGFLVDYRPLPRSYQMTMAKPNKTGKKSLFGMNSIHIEDGTIVLLRWSSDGYDITRSKRIDLNSPLSLDRLKEELCGEFA